LARPSDTLNASVLDAHASGDGPRLAFLYGQAAEQFNAAGDADAACFYWTQALVFSLEAGMEEARHYADELRIRGRL